MSRDSATALQLGDRARFHQRESKEKKRKEERKKGRNEERKGERKKKKEKRRKERRKCVVRQYEGRQVRRLVPVFPATLEAEVGGSQAWGGQDYSEP